MVATISGARFGPAPGAGVESVGAEGFPLLQLASEAVIATSVKQRNVKVAFDDVRPMAVMVALERIRCRTGAATGAGDPLWHAGER